MLKLRILTGSILGAILLLGLFLLPRLWAVAAFGVVFALAAWEWAGFSAAGVGAGVPVAAPARAAYTALMIVILWGSWIFTAQTSRLILMLAAACAWWLIALLWLWLAPQRHQPQVVLMCGVLVLAPAFAALARLVASENGLTRGPHGRGPQLVLWLVMMVCAADIGAYFAGRRFGRHKLAPRVSPGKTWEGAAGGLLMVCIVACAGAAYFSLPMHLAVAFGCGIGVFSIIGDLTESMFKRAAALKDSGTILPGHGGLLDRLDSVTAAAPLYALGLFGSGVMA